MHALEARVGDDVEPAVEATAQQVRAWLASQLTIFWRRHLRRLVEVEDLRLAERQQNHQRLAELKSIRKARFDLMQRMSELPQDLVFFTQITMEAADDSEFLDAMTRGE